MLGSKQVRRQKAHRAYETPAMAVKPLSQSPAVDKGVAYDPVIPQTLDSITDLQGLKRATADPKNLHTHGNVLYLGGTRDFNDWKDNIKHIPDWQKLNGLKHTVSNVAGAIQKATGVDLGAEVLGVPNSVLKGVPDIPSDWGNVRNTQAYKDARETLLAHPEINTISGYSKGGALALELQREFPQLKTRTFGSPTVSSPFEKWSKGAKNVERYANSFDPVAMFDSSAQTYAQSPNDNKGITGFFNHNYDTLESQFHSGGNPEMTRNLDGSYNLYG